MTCLPHCFFFFFFQAEDGIRDLYVTGVQTCALPICVPLEEIMKKYVGRFKDKKPDWAAFADAKIEGYKRAQRSEEHTSELQSRRDLVCRLLLEKKKNTDEQRIRQL